MECNAVIEYRRKKVLLMMPHFMEYDKSLIKLLSQKYDVTYFDNELHLKEFDTLSFFWRNLRRFLFKLGRKDWFFELFLSRYNKIDLRDLMQMKYDYIICINGAYVTNKIYKVLKDYNDNANMVLYWWDDSTNLKKTTHVRYFDKRYSFNMDDCEKYKMKYLPMFTENESISEEYQKEYDIAIVGTAHKDRFDLVKKFYNKYHEKYHIFIYLFHPTVKKEWCHNKPLSFREYLVMLKKSKVVLDLPFAGQCGPTTRPFDALLTKTKVITTNENIRKYPVYSDNIAIMDRELLDIDPVFLNSEYIETGLKPVSLEDWIDILISE